MRVLLLNQYYHPDIAATAQLAADLAEALVARGHEVTAVASAQPYTTGQRLPLHDEHAGVRIVRVPTTNFGRANRLLRSVDYATFLGGALLPVIAGARPDVIIALSTPPLVASLGLIAKLLRDTPLVFWVMDVYPDLAVELKALSAGGLVTRLLERLTRVILERSDAVIALDEAMRDRLIAHGASASRVEVIDNWCVEDDIRPATSSDNPLRRELGIANDTFTVSYSGNMGLGHDFDTLVGAMQLLRDEPIHWLFIGDGPRRPALELAARSTGARLSFLPYQARKRLPVSLTAAEASFVTLDPRMVGLLVPSKLYGILAAGIPVLYVGPDEGRVARVVRDHQVGVAVRNGDAAGLARAITHLRLNGDERRRIGQRGRSLFEARFARDIALTHHQRVLEQVAGAAC